MLRMESKASHELASTVLSAALLARRHHYSKIFCARYSGGYCTTPATKGVEVGEPVKLGSGDYPEQHSQILFHKCQRLQDLTAPQSGRTWS